MPRATPESAPVRPALAASALLPLRGYVGDADALPWRKLGDIAAVEIAPAGKSADKDEQLRLLRIKGGGGPRHGRHGKAMVMVPAGGGPDRAGHALRGDFDLHDAAIDH